MMVKKFELQLYRKFQAQILIAHSYCSTITSLQ